MPASFNEKICPGSHLVGANVLFSPTMIALPQKKTPARSALHTRPCERHLTISKERKGANPDLRENHQLRGKQKQK